eukprot:266871-Lingulodinium_polyedra.AAC.1
MAKCRSMSCFPLSLSKATMAAGASRPAALFGPVGRRASTSTLCRAQCFHSSAESVLLHLF